LPEEISMAQTRKNVTDAELDVLKVLWEMGPSTIRTLTDRLYPDGGTAHYATVQKLLERLEAKRHVRKHPKGRVNVYSSAVDRKGLIADRLRETADRLCEGSLTPLLTHLVGNARLTDAELAQLRELVDRLDDRALTDGGGS
jgi:BlaI family penicillinase repressor